MKLDLRNFLVQLSLLCYPFIVQHSAGFTLPSLDGTSVLALQGGRLQYLLLENDDDQMKDVYAPSPTPSMNGKHTEHHHFVYAPAPTEGRHKGHHHSHKNFHSIAPEPHTSSNDRKKSWIFAGPQPLPSIPSNPVDVPSSWSNNPPPPLPSLPLSPPPIDQGCLELTCNEPLTFTPRGVPCGCVWPIQIGLQFSINLYKFFPLLSYLAQEIADTIPLNRSQVRIMGANAADQQLRKTIVVINLVPSETMFSSSTAFSVYTKFWERNITIKTSTFGDYDVLYVRYPGLPSSPSLPSTPATIYIPPPGSGPEKPVGVDIPKGRKTDSSRNIIIIICLSSATVFVACMGFILLCLSKCGCLKRKAQQNLVPSDVKEFGRHGGGTGRISTRRIRLSSASTSFSSSLLACTGTTKIFTIDDIERATNNFSASRIVGEGGFGRVYGGNLDDGRLVAVKLLKRNDQQGDREFLAEVEILGRLHHRNLVELVGICAEDHCRCLVYELIPNGSVESHLHGADKEVAPLDWCTRMKIALGAARGLAYLHEDSIPRVIHRDFKSSNILLEDDYTPKVSDFGLARAAMEDGNRHISTHVMGTFGYLAPEYAMTGHLLVKSDVYSYGVVLLELLTGRKPVDLSQPPGQENLVSWARPLLTTNEGIESIIDPSIKQNVELDNFAKVAAIASMCVQPEVSHRPFMGEVVQALKLVCNEFEEAILPVSRSFSQDDIMIEMEMDSRISSEGLEKWGSAFDTRLSVSTLDLKSSSASFRRLESESFRRQYDSDPLRMGRKLKLWQQLRESRGSLSDNE